jgi:hypothetical protein
MRRYFLVTTALLLAGLVVGCAQQSLPTLPAPPVPGETATADAKPGSAAAVIGPVVESQATVSGNPTEVYALVARGALNCWFGGGGPLRATHVFHAEAAPPGKGGAAEIALHERDPAVSDQRGARAFRVSLAGDGGNVQIGTVSSRMPAAMADLMVRDVETWARGGSGCQLRTLAPPAPPPSAQAPAPAKKSGATKSAR